MVEMEVARRAAWLALVGLAALAAAQEVVLDEAKCVRGNPRFLEWVEDYRDETDEMERRCLEDVRELHTSLVGRHGPPIEIELKSAMCFSACQQYTRNIDFLLEISGCPCANLDEVFPLSELGHEFTSWCHRRPTEFLAQETGIVAEWQGFNTRYCRCNIAIACESTAPGRPGALVLALSLLAAGLDRR